MNRPCYSCNQPVFFVAPPPDPYQEYIDFALPEGQTQVQIPFSIVKISSALKQHGLVIFNSVDTVIEMLTFVITDIDNFGISLTLSAPPPTGNYRIKGLVSVLV